MNDLIRLRRWARLFQLHSIDMLPYQRGGYAGSTSRCDVRTVDGVAQYVYSVYWEDCGRMACTLHLPGRMDQR